MSTHGTERTRHEAPEGAEASSDDRHPRATPGDPRDTAHPAGTEQAADNAENEPAG